MIRNRASIKGKITGRVTSLDPVGLQKLELLYEQYPKDLNRKKDSKYVQKRDVIYAEHGFQKKRQTWNLMVFLVTVQCLIRLKLKEAFEVFKFEMGVSHNIVTDQGDALIADLMSETPTQDKVDGTNGHISVGTGWTGTTPKQNEAVNTPSGSPELLDATYPKNTGTFGAANDDKIEYRATFEAGDLDATDIDEAGLGNNVVEASGDNLAYGQITPAVTVGLSDTLQVDWELTILGA